MSLPFSSGASGTEILNWQNWFVRAYRSYAPLPTSKYDAASVAATKELQRRLGLPQSGSFDYVTALASGFPVPKHLGIVFRGTGGIIGQDYVSRVLQSVSDLVEEVNPSWAATMGGIPVGTAGGVGDPSMAAAIVVALADAQRIFAQRLAANPNIKVVVGGYSAGAVVAMQFRRWLLANHPNNYLCSFSFGDPSRPVGGQYYPWANPTPGHGISSDIWGDVTDARHCYLAQPGDMYTGVPVGPVGQVLVDGYDGVTKIQLSDPITTVKAIITMVTKIMTDSGIGLPSILQSFVSGPTGIVSFLIPTVIGILEGFIEGLIGAPASTTAGPTAGIEALIIALKFVAAQPPTAPHITYEFGEVWPGMTYLGLACQHVRDYASRVNPT